MDRRNQKKRIRKLRPWRGISQSVLKTALEFAKEHGYTMRDFARMRPIAIRCVAAIVTIAKDQLTAIEATHVLCLELRRANGGEGFDPMLFVPADYRDFNAQTWHSWACNGRGALVKVWST